MKRLIGIGVAMMALLLGCGAEDGVLKNIKTGMTPDEVKSQLGKPDYTRSLKSGDLWQYGIALDPKDPQVAEKVKVIIFKNGKVFEFGKAEDFLAA